MSIEHDRSGAGHPLVLVHGIGSHRQVWAPVVERLARERDVIAIDLPGFGVTAPLDPGTTPTPAALADAVERFLDELGLDRPDVGGNSLGGWIALELARRGRTRAAYALSPAGFWNARERSFSVGSLRAAHAAAQALGERVVPLSRSAAFRTVGAWQLAARPWAWPPDAFAAAFRNLAASPGWEPTLAAIGARHFTGAADVPTSATVAWGERDRLLLPRQAERARRAAPRARHLTLRGCGHVPTFDDPDQVAEVLLLPAA